MFVIITEPAAIALYYNSYQSGSQDISQITVSGVTGGTGVHLAVVVGGTLRQEQERIPTIQSFCRYQQWYLLTWMYM
jgi:hypothetical protein